VNPPEFKVVGSVSGEQSRRYKIDQGYFETDKGQVRFEITQGALGFGVLDSFTFKTVAGTLVGETISLVETGLNTGIFRAEVPLDAVGAGAQDGKLQVRSGEYLRVFYDDPKGDFGGAEQVRGSALYSQTVLGGVTILANTVWDKAGSPYLITGDVTVKEGVTLTVQAGVKVIFLTDSDSTVGGDTPYDSELRVNGTLSVVGTEAEPVLFTSSEETKRAGQWGGIYAATAKLNYAVVEGMMYGVKGQNVEVNNSIVRLSGGEGIRADGGSLVVKKTRVEKCSGTPIVGANCGMEVVENVVTDNGSGIRAEGGGNGFAYNVTGNEITLNRSNGITVNAPYNSRWQIVSNVISSNIGLSIASQGMGGNQTSMLISGNTIIGNRGVISLGEWNSGWESSFSGGFVFTGNQILNNKRSGDMMMMGSWFGLWNIGMKVVFGGNTISNSVSAGGESLNVGLQRYPFIFTNNVISGLQSGVSISRNNNYNSSKTQTVEELMMVIGNNRLTGNGGAESGVVVTDSTKGMLVVTNNVVSGGSGVGIRLQNDTESVAALVSNNTIQKNQGVGLRVSGKILPMVKGNVIEGNGSGSEFEYTDVNTSGEFEVSGNAIRTSTGVGIKISGQSQPIIKGNDLDGNGGYSIDNQTSKAIDARNNWWGVGTSAEMANGSNPKQITKIFDRYDDAS
jgi:hypothetical protein